MGQKNHFLELALISSNRAITSFLETGVPFFLSLFHRFSLSSVKKGFSPLGSRFTFEDFAIVKYRKFHCSITGLKVLIHEAVFRIDSLSRSLSAIFASRVTILPISSNVKTNSIPRQSFVKPSIQMARKSNSGSSIHSVNSHSITSSNIMVLLMPDSWSLTRLRREWSYSKWYFMDHWINPRRKFLLGVLDIPGVRLSSSEF